MQDQVHKTFWETLSAPLTVSIVSVLLAFIIGRFSERLKNRVLVLKYKLNFHSLGTAIEDGFWGSIKVLHNNREIKHLNFVTVTIVNEAINDAQTPLELNVWVDQRSQFLGYTGSYDNGLIIHYQDKFKTEFDNLINNKMVDEEGKILPEVSAPLFYIQSNRVLNLPTFNRKSAVTLNFLIENFEGFTPRVSLGVNAKSIKLIPEADAEKAENKKKIILGVIHLVTYSVAMLFIFTAFPTAKAALISCILGGLCAYAATLLIYHGGIFIKKLLS